MPIQRQDFYQAQQQTVVPSGEAEFYGNLANRLQSFQTQTMRTAGFNARNETRDALTAYSAETTLDVIKSVPEMERMAWEDRDDGLTPVERFDAAAGGKLAGMLENAPAQIKGDIEIYASRSFAQAREGIVTQWTKQQRDSQKAFTQQGIAAVVDQAATNYAKGHLMKAELDAETAEILIRNGLESGLLTPEEAMKTTREMGTRLRSSLVLGEFEEAYDAGAGIAYIQQWAEGIPDGFTEEEHDKVWSELETRLSRHQRHIDDAEKADDDARTQRHREGKREATLALMRGEEVDMVSLVENDQVPSDWALTRESRAAQVGPAFDDELVKAYYTLNLLEYSEEEIMADTDLTASTRVALVEERRQLLEDANNWQSKPAPRDGTRRIRTMVGIPEGVTVPGMSNEKMREANQALSDYYDQVQALPPEKREQEALAIADRIVKTIDADRALEELDGARTKLRQYQEQLATLEEGSEKYKTQVRQIERRQRQVDDLERRANYGR